MQNYSYALHEANSTAADPARWLAKISKALLRNPFNPISYTAAGRTLAAACEVFERASKHYGKPEFGLQETVIDGLAVPVAEKTVWRRPFCNLINFKRRIRRDDPKLLIVAPLSGHYATLLRGTVAALLPDHDIYITDWINARKVPLAAGRFGLDDYIDYVMAMLRHLGPDTHAMAVCQPAVPVLAAASRLAELADPCAPRSLVLMGGPIDTRISPTEVNRFAEGHDLDWFERHLVMPVPPPHAGAGRSVYPGFVQLSGFLGMNFERHVNAHHEFFQHLVQGDGESADKHREFYDEFLAVMDLPASFYLETVAKVFQHHELPRGRLRHRGDLVRPAAIKSTALLTVEGELDDITGTGQCAAAHGLCSGIPAAKKRHYEQPGVGHYGIFNGGRFREHIAPLIAGFIRAH